MAPKLLPCSGSSRQRGSASRSGAPSGGTVGRAPQHSLKRPMHSYGGQQTAQRDCKTFELQRLVSYER